MPQARNEAESGETFAVTVRQEQDYAFRVEFDWPDTADLLLDEPEPLGARRGPNASRLLVAAVANCLSASLVFCLAGKFKQPLGPISTRALGRLERYKQGRWRMAGISVTIGLSDEVGSLRHLERCAEQFDNFCVVTESVRKGIPVSVEVRDAAGQLVHEHGC